MRTTHLACVVLADSIRSLVAVIIIGIIGVRLWAEISPIAPGRIAKAAYGPLEYLSSGGSNSGCSDKIRI